MAKKSVISLLLTLFLASCAPQESVTQEPTPLSDDTQLNSFVRDVELNLEEHDWEQILMMADTSHYQTQVVEHGMAVPQYVAELFGLHRVGNNIERGDMVQWSDLERIESIELHELTQANGQYRITGTATLDDGGVLDLQAQIEQEQARFVLTGGLG